MLLGNQKCVCITCLPGLPKDLFFSVNIAFEGISKKFLKFSRNLRLDEEHIYEKIIKVRFRCMSSWYDEKLIRVLPHLWHWRAWFLGIFLEVKITTRYIINLSPAVPLIDAV